MDDQELRKQILQASFEAGACHIGSALSCVEIISNLYDNVLKDDDIFLFGKASGVATLYVILAGKGYFPKEKVAEYLKNYPLPSREVPGVIHSFGSLGHALPVACGMALGDRNRRVFVLLSDGELDEGSNYEAALFARQNKLTNLFVTIDRNFYQACGRTKDILDLDTALDFYEKTLPNCEIVNTLKGAGVDFMEGDNSWHYKNLTLELLKRALEQL